MGFVPQPAQLIGNKQDHGNLHDLGRLECQALRYPDPTPGAVDRHPKRRLHKSHQEKCKKIDFKRKRAIQVVIYLGHKQKNSEARCADDSLFCKIKHTGSVGTCTIKHDQAKTHQENNAQQKVIIKILRVCHKNP